MMGATDARKMYSNLSVNKYLHTVASLDFFNLQRKEGAVGLTDVQDVVGEQKNGFEARDAQTIA